MSEGWFDRPAAEHYRELLEAPNDPAPDDAKERIAEVVARARQQLAMRDVIALGFGGLVAVLVSLLATLASRLNRHSRERADPTADKP